VIAPTHEELDRRLAATAHLGNQTAGITSAHELHRTSQEREPIAEIVPLRSQLGVRLSDVQRERVEWLWDRRIPLGKLTLISGDPGLGKSLMTLDLAARITRGRRMPDNSPGFDGNVVILSAEDGLGDTIRPRLEVAGADLDRVVSLATLPTADGHERMFVIPDDLPQLIEVVQDIHAVLVIVDPLMAFLSSRINAHRDQDVRRALAPLAMAANKYRFAVAVVRHLNKSTTTGNPLYRGGGSIGIGGAARSEMIIGEDPANKERRIAAPTKSNLGPPMSALAYHIDAKDEVAYVVWDGTSDLSAETLLAGTSAEERSQRTIARDFILEMLADGPVDGSTVEAKAAELDIKHSTLWRAKKDLGVISRRAGFAGDGKWTWEVPKIVT
jgi:AAA domain